MWHVCYSKWPQHQTLADMQNSRLLKILLSWWKCFGLPSVLVWQAFKASVDHPISELHLNKVIKFMSSMIIIKVCMWWETSKKKISFQCWSWSCVSTNTKLIHIEHNELHVMSGWFLWCVQCVTTVQYVASSEQRQRAACTIVCTLAMQSRQFVSV